MKSYPSLIIRRFSCSAVRLAGKTTLRLEKHLTYLLVFSGKSTQVPAFILEDQLAHGIPCKIYCTEPRRISAVSLAQRVSRELGDSAGAVGTSSSLVGYSIRLESNTTRYTRLAYVTNGIALRMLEGGTGPNGQGTAFDEITVSKT
jgi:ATP-dependent RNA helicase DHX29